MKECVVTVINYYFVDEEHRIELARLRAELDGAIDALRATAVPRVARPPELVEALRALRAAIVEGDAAGLRERQEACERQLRRVQRGVAEDFVRHASRAWLR